METPNKSRSPTPMPWQDDQPPAEPIVADFDFEFSAGARERKILKIGALAVPLAGGATEFAHRLVKHHNLPVYVETELKEKLLDFESHVMQIKEHVDCDSSLDAIRSSSTLLDERIDEWDELFRREHASFSDVAEPSDESTFSDVYHTLIHSAALDTLLQLEHSYAINIEQELLEKNLAAKKLEERYVGSSRNLVVRI